MSIERASVFHRDDAIERTLCLLRLRAGELRPRRFGEPAPTFMVVQLHKNRAKILLRSSSGGVFDATEQVARLWGERFSPVAGTMRMPTHTAINLMRIHIGDALCPRPDTSLNPAVDFVVVT